MTTATEAIERLEEARLDHRGEWALRYARLDTAVRDVLVALSTPPADDVREALAETIIAAHPRPHWEARRTADAILAAFPVRPRGTVTEDVVPYEYCVVNGLGLGLYMAETLEEALDDIAKEQRVGPGELRPKRSIVRRRRAGNWETFS